MTLSEISLKEILDRSELHIRRLSAYMDDDAYFDWLRTLPEEENAVALSFLAGFYTSYMENGNFEAALDIGKMMCVEEYNRIFYFNHYDD